MYKIYRILELIKINKKDNPSKKYNLVSLERSASALQGLAPRKLNTILALDKLYIKQRLAFAYPALFSSLGR